MSETTGDADRSHRHDVHRTCPVAGCDLEHPRSMLMCRPHWLALPKALRDAVWRTYLFEGIFSARYQVARGAAIAHAEGRDA